MNPGSTASEIITRARRLLQEERHEENLGLLKSAVVAYPENPEIRLLYGTSLLAVDPDAARFEIATSIKLDPDDAERLTRAATLLYHLGEIEAARSYAGRAAGLAPEGFVLTSDLTNLGGKLAAADGDPVLAEEALRIAVELSPERPEFAHDLAVFLRDSGRATEAREVIDNALEAAVNRGRPRDALLSNRLEELRKAVSEE